MRTLMLGLLLAVTWSSLAEACAVGYGQLFYNAKTETITTMSVESGKECSILTGANAISQFTGMRISSQARNGVADIKDCTVWRYRSRSSFKGSDEFVAVICGAGPTGKGCATVRVKVTVY
jgi:hypothetical protein